jgi:predicted Ser/Thr protein kinase
MKPEVSDLLHSISQRSETTFAEERRVLSFREYLSLAWDNPRQHARTAAQYLKDCFDHFGWEDTVTPVGRIRRFKVFEFVPESSSEYPVEGLEDVQADMYRCIQQFCEQGFVDRLILLHGPNGAAKSSLIHAVSRALQAYSQTDEGALYRYSWVFPTDKVARKRVGFADDDPTAADMSSFADLADEETATTLSGELNESPLMLLNKEERRGFIQRALEKDHATENFRPGRAVLEGDLCPRSRKIFEAQLRSYHGNLEQVWRHIRVERFFLSLKFRTGLTTVEPQLHVDAGVRQLTYDQGLASLPANLKNMTLEEVYGDLVDANRGLIEYNDLLKRPIETFKYLLATCEKSTVAVPGQTLDLDVVFMGSSNESHLNEIKQTSDFASFKGRFSLFKVPYLRDYKVEQRIYDRQVLHQIKDKHIGPQVTELAAIWAVLTRLKKPDPKNFQDKIRPLLEKVGPFEKAEMFATGRLPDGLTAEANATLRGGVESLYRESKGDLVYEGLFGASPRAMKALLFSTANRAPNGCLTANLLLNEITEFISEKNLNLYLKIEPVGDYHNYPRFTEMLRKRYRRQLIDDVRVALGQVDQSEFKKLLVQYLNHTGHMVRNERLTDPITGTSIEPDKRLMAEFEDMTGVPKEQAEIFREQAVQRVGAFRLEHPDQEIDLEQLFATELAKARKKFHDKHSKKAAKVVKAALDSLENGAKIMDPGFQQEVSEFLENFQESNHFCDVCLREGLSEFLKSESAGA